MPLEWAWLSLLLGVYGCLNWCEALPIIPFYIVSSEASSDNLILRHSMLFPLLAIATISDFAQVYAYCLLALSHGKYGNPRTTGSFQGMILGDESGTKSSPVITITSFLGNMCGLLLLLLGRVSLCFLHMFVEPVRALSFPLIRIGIRLICLSQEELPGFEMAAHLWRTLLSIAGLRYP